MPTLFRFITLLAILAGAVFAAMVALATLVEPRKGEISVRVPIDEPARPAVPATP